MPDADDVADLAERLAGVERGLVILGSTDSPAESVTAATLAERLGWPLLPDIASQSRTDGVLDDMGPVVAHYDLALASPVFAHGHRPDAVVLIGGRPLSKRLLALIESSRPDPYVVARPGLERFDPAHVVTDRVAGDVFWWASALASALPPEPAPSAWLTGWQSASDAAETAIVAEIGRDLTEPFVARTVALLAPALVLAASMPIRDADVFASASGSGERVFANRGASGIDGTVATAHGVARGLDAPVVLLIGDLALIHDQTSLMLLRDVPTGGPPVVVVAVNNDGGGIFHFLPVARGAHPLDPATFEAAMAAPHGLTSRHAAAQVGLPYHAPTTADAFEAVLAEAIASGASALIEVQTDRTQNAALHARITAAAAAAVDDALGL